MNIPVIVSRNAKPGEKGFVMYAPSHSFERLLVI